MRERQESRIKESKEGKSQESTTKLAENNVCLEVATYLDGVGGKIRRLSFDI